MPVFWTNGRLLTNLNSLKRDDSALNTYIYAFLHLNINQSFVLRGHTHNVQPNNAKNNTLSIIFTFFIRYENT